MKKTLYIRFKSSSNGASSDLYPSDLKLVLKDFVKNEEEEETMMEDVARWLTSYCVSVEEVGVTTVENRTWKTITTEEILSKKS